MKIVQIVPVSNDKPTLKTLLKQTEIRLRGKGTALIRKKEGKWMHVKYPGWINWDIAKGGIIVAEVKSLKEKREWQLLNSFIGYVDRHLGEYIQSITIHYY